MGGKTGLASGVDLFDFWVCYIATQHQTGITKGNIFLRSFSIRCCNWTYWKQIADFVDLGRCTVLLFYTHRAGYVVLWFCGLTPISTPEYKV